jgi:hypothetical protein
MTACRRLRRREGQSLIESSLIIALACLIFFGLFQVARLYAAKAIATYSAAAGARAKAVGFNEFMIYKVVRVASIPNAGAMLNPGSQNAAGGTMWATARAGDLVDYAMYANTPYSDQYDIERTRIPETEAILDYEYWDDMNWSELVNGDLVGVRFSQEYPLAMPFRESFYGDDELRIQSGGRDDSHYVYRGAHSQLYLE